MGYEQMSLFVDELEELAEEKTSFPEKKGSGSALQESSPEDSREDARETALSFKSSILGAKESAAGEKSLFSAPSRYAEVSSLEELKTICLACRGCSLCSYRTQAVFGEGNENARLMLVGEGPGRVEDETGRPFVGQAGQLLDRILAAAGFTREEVFIGNVVKCRPPGNRLPTPQEAAACRPFLEAQIRLIKPRIIVCLGALATQTLVDPRARITAVRGQWFEKSGYWIIPTFHPAALLRDPSKKRPVWEDFKEIRRRYDNL